MPLSFSVHHSLWRKLHCAAERRGKKWLPIFLKKRSPQRRFLPLNASKQHRRIVLKLPLPPIALHRVGDHTASMVGTQHTVAGCRKHGGWVGLASEVSCGQQSSSEDPPLLVHTRKANLAVRMGKRWDYSRVVSHTHLLQNTGETSSLQETPWMAAPAKMCKLFSLRQAQFQSWNPWRLNLVPGNLWNWTF